MASFQGKVIAITGAASGMGLATARLLASAGANVSLADLNEQGLKDAVATLPTEHGNRHIYTVVDVRDSKSVDGWIDRTVEELGKLDGAVNMAGVILPTRPIVEETEERWDLTFDVNVKGVFLCLRAQIKNMNPGGSIVSATSIYGQIGAPGVSPYCASKAAVIGMSRSAAKENPQVRINCISPGVADTPMLAKEPEEDVARDLANSILNRKGQPAEIANVIIFLLSPQASFCHSGKLSLASGMAHVAPTNSLRQKTHFWNADKLLRSGRSLVPQYQVVGEIEAFLSLLIGAKDREVDNQIMLPQTPSS